VEEVDVFHKDEGMVDGNDVRQKTGAKQCVKSGSALF
jgi:hypothetical protein